MSSLSWRTKLIAKEKDDRELIKFELPFSACSPPSAKAEFIRRQTIDQSYIMQTLEGKILSILRSRPSQTGGEPSEQSQETNHKVWRMRVSYSGPQTLYEMELREPLKSYAAEKYTVGLNGFVEFELFSEPQIAAGDAIWIDAYEPGEKILG